jgi:GT2 family glycosyltransferase
MLLNEFPQIGWTRWDANRGYVAARNYLMQSATANYFVSLDDDAVFVKGDEVALAVENLEQNPSIGAIAFDILSPDRSDPNARRSARAVAMFIGCGHAIRLAAARAVGFYDPAPGLYGGEEKDLCLRLIDAGYQILLLPGVHVRHDKTELERNPAAQHRSGVCNDLIMTLRRTPSWLLPLALLSKFYRHTAFAIRNRLTRPSFEGFGLFVRSIPRVWPSRRPVTTWALRRFMRLRV